MLEAMGLRLWAPPPASSGAAARAIEVVTPEIAAPPTAAPTAAPATARAATPPAPVKPMPAVVAAAADDARARRIAGLDWAGLRREAEQCRACGLCESRRQVVFGVGHVQARWMVVGEAPGEQEDLQGEPFVGPSGQLLDNMLSALGLTRATDGPEPPEQRVYIANTLKCRPPRNRNPEPAEMVQCEPFLMRQIALVQPRLILAMGRFAVQALLRSNEPVGKLRGKVHSYQGVPLVVTYHPAYLLRNLPDKARAWEDLCLAAGVAEGGTGHARVR
jgi:DNA polymerase